MIILTKITLTIAIITLVMVFGACSVSPRSHKALRAFSWGVEIGLGGLVLCLIAYVWMR